MPKAPHKSEKYGAKWRKTICQCPQCESVLWGLFTRQARQLRAAECRNCGWEVAERPKEDLTDA